MNNKKLWCFAVLVVAIATLVLWVPVRKTIEITGENGESYRLLASPGDIFTIAYTHSMYHVNQKEIYQIREKDFLHQTMFFGDMQAAAYYDSFSRYELIKQADGSATIKNIGTPYTMLCFAVGHGTSYSFTVDNKATVDVNQIFPHSSRLILQIKNASLLDYLIEG